MIKVATNKELALGSAHWTRADRVAGLSENTHWRWSSFELPETEHMPAHHQQNVGLGFAELSH